MAVKNTCGFPLGAGNIYMGTGTGWSSNVSGGSTSVTTNTAVPAGAFLAAGAYTDCGSNNSGVPEWTCAPQSGWASAGLQYMADGHGDDDELGGVTITTTAVQTISINNTQNNNDGVQETVWWVQYP